MYVFEDGKDFVSGRFLVAVNVYKSQSHPIYDKAVSAFIVQLNVEWHKKDIT